MKPLIGISRVVFWRTIDQGIIDAQGIAGVLQAPAGQLARVTAVAPDTPEPVADILSRALQKAPDDRYPDAAAMARDLRITCELSLFTCARRSAFCDFAWKSPANQP